MVLIIVIFMRGQRGGRQRGLVHVGFVIAMSAGVVFAMHVTFVATMHGDGLGPRVKWRGVPEVGGLLRCHRCSKLLLLHAVLQLRHIAVLQGLLLQVGLHVGWYQVGWEL